MPSVIESSEVENKADSECKASVRSEKNEENTFWMAALSRRQGRARHGKSDVRERPSSKWGPLRRACYKFINVVNLALPGSATGEAYHSSVLSVLYAFNLRFVGVSV